MIQKFLIQVILALVPAIVTGIKNLGVSAYRAVTDWITRRKRIKGTQDAAQKVESDKKPDDVRADSDNLP